MRPLFLFLLLVLLPSWSLPLPSPLEAVCGPLQWAEEFGRRYHDAQQPTLVLDFVRTGCKGMGNLFLTVYHWFLVALLSGRPLFLRFPPACDLAKLFHGRLFDWAAIPNRSDVGEVVTALPALRAAKEKKVAQRFRTQRPDQLFPAKVMYVVADVTDTSPLQFLLNSHVADIRKRCPLFALPHTQRHACVHHLLFSPSAELRRVLDAFLTRLGPNGTAVHIRLGDQASGINPKKLQGRAKGDVRSPPLAVCEDLAVGSSGNAYLASDAAQKFSEWQARYGGRVITQEGVPRH
eukprot:EG_transcript_21364